MNIKSNRNKQKFDITKTTNEKRLYFKPNNQQHSNATKPTYKSKQMRKNCVHIKDYKLKLKIIDSSSENKLIKRKSSILSNIYRPRSQNKDEHEIKDYLNSKNMSLIKQNIMKLQIHFPKEIPKLLQNSSRQRLHWSNSSRQECKTQRINRQKRQPIFMFQKQQQTQFRELFTKRKLSLHFDRSKYFNCESFLNKEHKQTYVRRQKTEYRINPALRKQTMIQHKTNKNQCMIDDFIPIIKQRNKKPKTAGGFLKKYSVEQISIRPDFQLHLTEEDLF